MTCYVQINENISQHTELVRYSRMVSYRTDRRALRLRLLVGCQYSGGYRVRPADGISAVRGEIFLPSEGEQRFQRRRRGKEMAVFRPVLRRQPDKRLVAAPRRGRSHSTQGAGTPGRPGADCRTAYYGKPGDRRRRHKGVLYGICGDATVQLQEL